MKVGIYTNLTRDLGGRATIALVDFLKSRNFTISVCEELASLDLKVPCVDKETLARSSDLVVVFGGDGTILRIAKECARYKTKVFSVNLGNMGFLAEVENVELSNIFHQINDGNYQIDERALIEANFGGETYIALNEVVIERGARTKVMRGEVKVDNSLLDVYTADGIIISTPTGSTAYSLSAGGPIVAPDVGAIIVCPICPHTLNSRPVVVSDKKAITVSVVKTDSSAHLSVDGEDVCGIPIGGTVIIKKSQLSVSFIRLKKYNYYEKLLKKMSNWTSVNKE